MNGAESSHQKNEEYGRLSKAGIVQRTFNQRVKRAINYWKRAKILPPQYVTLGKRKSFQYGLGVPEKAFKPFIEEIGCFVACYFEQSFYNFLVCVHLKMCTVGMNG